MIGIWSKAKRMHSIEIWNKHVFKKKMRNAWLAVIRNAKTMYYMGSRVENRKYPKILAHCETVVGRFG